MHSAKTGASIGALGATDRPSRLGRMRYLTQLLDRVLERALSVAVVLPGGALRQERRDRANRKALGVEIGFDLCPGDRHRHSRAGSRAGREWRHGRRHTIVAQVVQKDAPIPQALGHLNEVKARIVPRHLQTDVMREALGLRPGQRAAFANSQWCNDVQALAASRLAKADETQIIEAVAHFSRRSDNG